MAGAGAEADTCPDIDRATTAVTQCEFAFVLLQPERFTAGQCLQKWGQGFCVALIVSTHRFHGIKVTQLQCGFVYADHIQGVDSAVELTQIKQTVRDTGLFEQSFVSGSAVF